MHDTCSEVAVIGAGPYGLAAAAHLRAAGVETRIFGEPMEFWDRNMPRGMLLRSRPECSQISTPYDDLSLDRYLGARGRSRPRRVAGAEFVEYGRWIQRHVAPDVDRRRVTRVERMAMGFRLDLEDGTCWRARRIAVATGIGPFKRRPRVFEGIPSWLASHSSEPDAAEHREGNRVLVMGGGQSAIEAAALLAESGADVEILLRAPAVRWLRSATRADIQTPWTWIQRAARNAASHAIRPQLDIMGPRVVSWLLALPRLYRHAPDALQRMLTGRAMRPAAADWLLPRLEGVRLTTGRRVETVASADSHLTLRLDDGTTRSVDHVVLATGYHIDVRGYRFLAHEILNDIGLRDGYPELGVGFESSVSGLHFLGAPAAQTFGPICRFVVGTRYSARALTRYVRPRTGSRPRPRRPVARRAGRVPDAAAAAAAA